MSYDTLHNGPPCLDDGDSLGQHNAFALVGNFVYNGCTRSLTGHVQQARRLLPDTEDAMTLSVKKLESTLRASNFLTGSGILLSVKYNCLYLARSGVGFLQRPVLPKTVPMKPSDWRHPPACTSIQ